MPGRIRRQAVPDRSCWPKHAGDRAFGSQSVAVYSDAGWEVGKVRATSLFIDGVQVVGPRAGSVADPSGGPTVDAEARVAITGILAALRQHGLISP